jgi:hypothetical protein
MKQHTRRDPLRLLLVPAALLCLWGCGEGESTSTPTASHEPSTPTEPAEAPETVTAAAPAPVAGEPVEHDHDGDGVADHPEEAGAEAAPAAVAHEEIERSAGARPGKPRLDVDETDHDFGTAVEGERLSHTFHLKSTGDTDLIINSAKPTCGCTVAKVAVLAEDGETSEYKMGDPLPPGTELELLARLDTKNKHNLASSKINIFCNDPRSTVTLGLKAQVDQYFQISPASLAFGEISVADVVSKTFTVSGKKPGPFLLSQDGRTTPPGMVVELQPQNADADGKAEVWTVKVTLGPDCREGNLGFPVQLRSDEEVAGAQKLKGGEMPTYGASVMVTAKVRGLISWEPQYLSFGLVRPGQVVSRSLSVATFDGDFAFNADDISIRLTGPNDQQPDFPWASSFSHVITPSEDNQSFRVELTLDGLPEEADGSFQGRVMISTGHPQKPEIPVLFSGVCRPGVVRSGG